MPQATYTIKTDNDGKIRIFIDCARHPYGGTQVAIIVDGELRFDRLADTREVLGQISHEQEMFRLGLNAPAILAICAAGIGR